MIRTLHKIQVADDVQMWIDLDEILPEPGYVIVKCVSSLKGEVYDPHHNLRVMSGFKGLELYEDEVKPTYQKICGKIAGTYPQRFRGYKLRRQVVVSILRRTDQELHLMHWNKIVAEGVVISRQTEAPQMLLRLRSD